MIENTHAALYAGPPQDVFRKVQHGDDPKSHWPHFGSGTISRAFFLKTLCRCQTDTAVSAGDYRDFSFEPFHFLPSLAYA